MATNRTLRPEPEQALLDRVLAALKADGWLTMHISDSRMIVNRNGRFELVGDPECAGFPDLLAAHAASGRVVAIELKRPGCKPRQNQAQWLATLAMCGVEVFVMDARNESEVLARLTRVPVAA